MACKALAFVEDIFWESSTACTVAVKYCVYDTSQNVAQLTITGVPPPSNATQFNNFLIDNIRTTLSIEVPDTICLLCSAQIG